MASDFGPKERANHGTFRVERVRGFKLRVRNIDSTALDSLFYRKMITGDQHVAGGKLAQDCLMARMLSPPSLNMQSNTKTQWSDIPNKVAVAIGRINEAMSFIKGECGAWAEDVVLDLIVRDRPPRDLQVLKLALSSLAKYYYKPKPRYRFSI